MKETPHFPQEVDWTNDLVGAKTNMDQGKFVMIIPSLAICIRDRHIKGNVIRYRVLDRWIPRSAVVHPHEPVR